MGKQFSSILAILYFLVLSTAQATDEPDFQLGSLEVITVTNASQMQEIALIAPDGSDLKNRSERAEIQSLAEQPAGSDHWQTSVAFSPNGDYFATGSYDTAVRVWDVNSGVRIHTLLGHLEMVNDIAFSPDSTIIASVSGAFDWYQDFSVRLWDVQTGEELYVLRGHTAQVQSVVFHPIDNLLVTTGFDGKVLAWDLDEIIGSPDLIQEEYMLLFESDDWLRDVAFDTSEGLITAVGDTDIVIYNWDTSQLSVLDSSPGVAAYDAEFTPDGLHIFTVGHDSVMIWNTNTGEQQDGWIIDKPVFEDQDPFPTEIEFSSGSAVVAIAIHDQIQILSFTDRSLITTLIGHEYNVADLAFSPDGKLLVSVSFDGTIRLWGVPESDG